MIYNLFSKIYEIYIKKNLNLNFINDLKILADDINDLFKNADDNIKNDLLKKTLKPELLN